MFANTSWYNCNSSGGTEMDIVLGDDDDDSALILIDLWDKK